MKTGDQTSVAKCETWQPMSLSFLSAVRGFHVYTSVGTICLGQCLGGAENTAALAIAVVKHGAIGDKD